VRALLSVLVVAALAGVAAADAPKQEMAAADVTKWLAFFDKLVGTVEKSAGNGCDRLAVDVSALIDRNKDALDTARNARAAGKKLPESAQQHMLDGVKRMIPAMQKCGQHERVKAAFAKLDLNRKS